MYTFSWHIFSDQNVKKAILETVAGKIPEPKICQPEISKVPKYKFLK